MKTILIAAIATAALCFMLVLGAEILAYRMING